MRNPAIQAILDQIDIVSLISEDSELQGGRAILSGWHRAHDSNSKESMKVWTDDDPHFYCFHCNTGGSAIDYVMSMGRAESPMGAILWLCDHFNIAPPVEKDIGQWGKTEAERRLVEPVFQDAAEYYERCLAEKGADYFTERGLSEASIAEARLGYADGGLLKALRGKYSSDTLALSGLFVRFNDGGMKDAFERRYVFPYISRGKTVYFIARRDTDDISALPEWNRAKYRKQNIRSENHPYVTEAVTNSWFYSEDSGYADAEVGILTEGPIDCIMAKQEGWPCMAPASSSFPGRDHQKLLRLTRRWNTVAIIYDDDEAGRRGARSDAMMLTRNARHVKVIALPQEEGGKIDLAEFLRGGNVNE